MPNKICKTVSYHLGFKLFGDKQEIRLSDLRVSTKKKAELQLLYGDWIYVFDRWGINEMHVYDIEALELMI